MVKPFKNLLLQNQRANDLVTGYVALGTRGPIIVCSNDDPRLTLTYFTARSDLVPYAFVCGKTVRKSFNGRKLQEMTRVTKGVVCACPRAIYMYKKKQKYV